MPDKQFTIATYAAGASLAAITLIYVFAPTFFLDEGSTSIKTGLQKNTAVGLYNPGNDCFINAVLQALTGLGDLRNYLIRETHRRKLDGLDVYSQALEHPSKIGLPLWKIKGLQLGIVTYGLKEILDALNERPIYKKIISASFFIKVLEEAFGQKISVQQQDAQEFFQVVAERLCDEYHAGQRVRCHAQKAQSSSNPDTIVNQSTLNLESEKNNDSAELKCPGASDYTDMEKEILSVNGDYTHLQRELEEGFPFEGELESQIECLTCGFKPKPTTTTFCSLTLSLPQVSSTTLSSCFDQMFKTEHIDDFKCEKCRLLHALNSFKVKLSQSTSESSRVKIEKSMQLIQEAIEKDPEADLNIIEMPDPKFAPKRKIARYTRITSFPKVMAIHLSRSIFNSDHYTFKNSAKVAFPELLPLGGLLNQNLYRLSSVVCHKGSHNTGHYESFRRQTVNAPFSTPDTFKPAKFYKNTSFVTPLPVPKSQAATSPSSEETLTESNSLSSSPKHLSQISVSSSSLSNTGTKYTSEQSFSDETKNTSITSKVSDKIEPVKFRERARSTLSKVSILAPKKVGTYVSGAKGPFTDTRSMRNKVKHFDRWWRISDDKVKECKTADVLGMQREVYMLFFELEK